MVLVMFYFTKYPYKTMTKRKICPVPVDDFIEEIEITFRKVLSEVLKEKEIDEHIGRLLDKLTLNLDFVNQKELCRWLGVAPSTVRRWDIPVSVRRGGKPYYSVREVIEYLQKPDDEEDDLPASIMSIRALASIVDLNTYFPKMPLN